MDVIEGLLGVWAAQVAGDVDGLLLRLRAALTRLDVALPAGQRPSTVDDIEVVVTLAAQLHGEWARIHPFANGNGRTARTWVAWLMLRYQLPMFLTLKHHVLPTSPTFGQAAPLWAGPRTLPATTARLRRCSATC